MALLCGTAIRGGVMMLFAVTCEPWRDLPQFVLVCAISLAASNVRAKMKNDLEVTGCVMTTRGSLAPSVGYKSRSDRGLRVVVACACAADDFVSRPRRWSGNATGTKSVDIDRALFGRP